MKILVTNDDSVNAEGLKTLTGLAADFGEVFVVAPWDEQSAKSHAINITTGFQLEKVKSQMKCEVYYCRSTPADCVRSAHFALNKDFDIVFSGINSGFNLGEDIFYSGTVSAAIEATFHNKKAIAFSAPRGKTYIKKATFKKIMDFFTKNNLFDLCDIYNVNIPENPQKLMITRQGKTHFNADFTYRNNLWHQEGYHQYHCEKDITTDVWAVCNGCISVTPLTVDRTDYAAYKKLLKNS